MVYRYTFGQKAMFVALWLSASIFVFINLFSNPLLSLSSAMPTLSEALALAQFLLLGSLWYLFSKASYSMESILRWLGVGIIILPYLVQVGLLSYRAL